MKFKGEYHMETLYIEYDDLLINRINHVDPTNFYGTNPSPANEQLVLGCFKYVIEKVLCWSPETAMVKFDEYMIRTMKLAPFVNYITYPDEIPVGYPKYILSLIYPGRIRFSQQQLIEDVYANILKEPGKQFPRDYFAGGVGFKRFCFCVKYMIENFYPCKSIPDMYDFLLSVNGRKAILLYRLQTPMYQFKIDILEVMRYLTKELPNGELYYNYYKFKQQYDEINKNIVKEQTKDKKKSE